MIRSTFAVLLCCAAASASAQQQDFSKVEIQTVTVAPGLAMLIGAGGNLAVSTGANGPILVDDQFAPLAPKITAAVKALQDAPIRFIVNTHFHFDHTGGNEPFGRAGALIVAHDNVRKRLSTEQVSKIMNRTFPPLPPDALPVVTFGDGVTFHWNGETISVEHVARAHTDGDALVWFEKANAVHTGDTFVNGFYPFIDVESGGTTAGLLASADRVLARANAGTKIIPGHGPLATPKELRAFRDMLVEVKRRVEAAIAAGKTRDAFLAERPLADLDPEWGDGFLKSDQVVTLIWLDLAGR